MVGVKFIRVTILLVALFAATLLAESITPLPTITDVARVWIGQGFRLELDANGTGYFCQSFPYANLTPYLYRIESWKLSKFTVELKIRSIGDAPRRSFEKLTFDHGVVYGLLDKQRITFFTETQWRQLAAQNEERIRQGRKENLR